MSPHSSRRKTGPLAPNPELWAALGKGPGLRAILERFYARVFADARLAPFFHGVTQERVIDKQYSFLASIFSGESIYFGDRPRNAHHWMVISDELFDYREALFEACLVEAGLPEHQIRAWQEVHEVYRKGIVKSAPFPRIMGGVAMPLDGWGTETLSVGSLCDGCQGELEVGATARYHLRLGRTLCEACAPAEEAQ